MRKAIYSLVVAVYFLLSCGVVVQLHYCMDRLQEIGLFADQHEEACDDCGMDVNADNDCCQDRTEVIKLVQDQSIQHAPISNFKILAEYPRDFNEQAFVPKATIIVGQNFATQHEQFYRDRYRYRLLSVFRI